MTVIERFESKYEPEPNSGCWLWTGGYGRKDYRRFSMKRGKMTSAQRAAYELYVGPIPAGLVIDHLCRNHACVNPTHLEPVTIGENVMRGDTRTAANAKKAACHLGHVYADVGIYRTGRRRNCMECRRISDRKRYVHAR
jgi:hypothetical protein